MEEGGKEDAHGNGRVEDVERQEVEQERQGPRNGLEDLDNPAERTGHAIQEAGAAGRGRRRQGEGFLHQRVAVDDALEGEGADDDEQETDGGSQLHAYFLPKTRATVAAQRA